MGARPLAFASGWGAGRVPKCMHWSVLSSAKKEKKKKKKKIQLVLSNINFWALVYLPNSIGPTNHFI